MNTQERKNRIIARGEHSNHSHVVVGLIDTSKVSEKPLIET